MTRLMGDAEHANAAQLAAVPGLQVVAGYDTGDPTIDWTAADVAMFPGIPVVMIDQGYTGSPNLSATVRDVEYGAWQPGQAVSRAGWNVPRPTIYCTTGETGYNLATVLADGWQGDLWLAIDGWQPGGTLPAAPGCTIVAVQNNYSNPAYDLSVVLDPAWPQAATPTQENDMPIVIEAPDGSIYLLSGGKLHHILDPQSATAFINSGLTVVKGISAAEQAALVADFPAGNPSVTVPAVNLGPITGTMTAPVLTSTITLNPA